MGADFFIAHRQTWSIGQIAVNRSDIVVWDAGSVLKKTYAKNIFSTKSCIFEKIMNLSSCDYLRLHWGAIMGYEADFWHFLENVTLC